MDLEPNAFLRAVVDGCGLAPVIARPVIERACRRAGVDPAELTVASLPRAIDSIETLLKVYLPSGEVATRVAALRRLVDPRTMP